MRARVFSSLLTLLIMSPPAFAAERRVEVSDDASLARAIREAQPGTRVVVAPGNYRGRLFVTGIRGTAEAPVIIEAADPKKKPVFVNGTEALHLSNCSHVTLRNLAARGQTGNGINVDDAGNAKEPSHHVTIEGLDISQVGPTGNHDALKLSGIDDLVVRNCTMEGWGGQGIDMVGCHRVVIENCTLRGKAGFTPSAGVQAKGGSSEVAIRGCTFLNAGERAVNIGGSTGLEYFRPIGAKYEAKDVTVEGCRFVGSMSPIAFVGVDGAVVRYNTIHQPEKWVVRILQETTAEGFIACHNGRMERNLIVAKQAVLRTAINVGPNTQPESFVFQENYWFCTDRPEASRPQLPVSEEKGVYGPDPEMALKEGVPGAPGREGAKAFGADADWKKGPGARQ